MLPAFLISLREMLEAALIVATITGMLQKLKVAHSGRITFLAVLTAVFGVAALVSGGSWVGAYLQRVITDQTEPVFEGAMMILSAVFITGAVFWLHKHFAYKKLTYLQNLRSQLGRNGTIGTFMLIIVAILREGIEIALFLTTTYLESNTFAIMIGFLAGTLLAFTTAYLLMRYVVRFPLYRMFQITSLLLILFAGGLLGRGVGEFVEIGVLPAFPVTVAFIPASGVISELTHSIFGWAHSMNSMQLIMYVAYVAFMRWFVFERPNLEKQSN